MSITYNGAIIIVDGWYKEGTSSTIGTTTRLYDVNATQEAGDAHRMLEIVSGAGAGSRKVIANYDNTAHYWDVLGHFSEAPDATSVYRITYKSDDVVAEDIAQGWGYVLNIGQGVCETTKTIRITGGFSIIAEDMNFVDCRGIVAYDGGLIWTGVRLQKPDGSYECVGGPTLRFVGVGGYGNDPYQTNGLALANDNSEIDFNDTTFDNHGLTGNRNDIDFRPLSTVSMYGCKILGPSGSYHHFNSDDMHLDGVTVYNAYSLEMMRSPIYCNNLIVFGNATGLSVYPNTGQDVVIRNLIATDNYDTFKRLRGKLTLIDAQVDWLAVSDSSTNSPVRALYSFKAQVKDELGTPISGRTVKFFKPSCPLMVDSGVLEANKNWVHVDLSEYEWFYLEAGDTIRIYDDNNTVGEIVTIVSTQSASDYIIVDTDLSNQYQITANAKVQVYEEKMSDSNGYVEEVLLPRLFVRETESIENSINYYSGTRINTDYNGTDVSVELSPTQAFEDILFIGAEGAAVDSQDVKDIKNLIIAMA